jgi:hypothetical protein
MNHAHSYLQRLSRYYLWYAGCFFAFLLALGMLEREGMPRLWIGYLFMFATIALYATIGVITRTSNVSEYYVAGRRVPALFNGMATAADWISAASFISLTGSLYLRGFDGLAYIMGWTGGYCLVALLIAPYLRRFAQYTIPDFLAARYGGGAGGRDHHRLVHLRGRADLRGRPDRVALHRRRFLGRYFPGPGQHPGVLLPRRDARDHLDPGGAVHHHPGRLSDPDHVAVGEALG